MNDDFPELEDFLMGSGFMLEVFMLQMTLEVARSKDNPEEWVRGFVSKMHERVDANEARTGTDQRYPAHELARQGFDRLGAQANHILKLQP